MCTRIEICAMKNRANPAASNQKVRERTASPNSQSRLATEAGRAAALSAGSSTPSGTVPISRGLSLSTNSAIGTNVAAMMTAEMSYEALQPQLSMKKLTSGTKIAPPNPNPAVANPTAVPRRRSNHRDRIHRMGMKNVHVRTSACSM